MNTAILKAALFCPISDNLWGLPLLLWGEPGTGKTHLIEALARALGLPYHRLSPAERGEGQFGVVPVPGADGFLHYPPPADLARDFAHTGLLFVDEINTAPPALQSPLLGLVQLRTLGAHRFPGRVRVIGAANETMDAAGGWDLAPALRNRFGHVEYTGLDVTDWAAGLISGFAAEEHEAIAASDLEARVMEAWPLAIAKARGMVAGFVTRRPELLHKRPAKGGNTKAFPTRRTCEYATIALASAEVHGLSETDADTLVSAFVGLPWVTELRTWALHMDLPDPAAFLDGKEPFQHDERRLDRTIAMLGSCTALVVPENAARRNERAEALWKFIATVANDAADLTVATVRAMLKARLMTASWSKPGGVGSKLHPVLIAAGVVAGVSR